MGSFCAQAGGFVGVSSDHDHLLLDGMREVRATQSLTQKDISGERGSLRTWPPMALSSPLDGLVASLGGMPRMEGETWSLELPQLERAVIWKEWALPTQSTSQWPGLCRFSHDVLGKIRVSVSWVLGQLGSVVR